MGQIPQQDELVLVTVKKIVPYGAFCTLDEYNGKEAFVHISEVAPRWIKNIHEFLSEGQHLVAKVWRVDVEKNQIDISLKRVTDAERKAKLEESRKERRAAKLFEVALKLAKSTKNEESGARQALIEKYGSLVEALEEIGAKGQAAIEGLKIEKGLAKALIEVATRNARKAKAEVSGLLTLYSHAPDGIHRIKKILQLSPAAVQGAEISIHYLGAPKYQIKVVADDYKTAEKMLSDAASQILSAAKEEGAVAEFSRTQGRK
ncbi:MAG: translation initiation factor IF-2 subunit alpha [Candidatus Micrarchaeota archaeon]|nr:translation initiation factor IF-2 subunit alpha [Candidatus Micrarchaeota archaeon]